MCLATLTDVAKKANVSKMTVSRVLNHPEKVTDELKELVFQAMKELNYRPNIAAKALANNRTQVIKFFILEEMDTTEPYFMSLLMGISRELDKHHYSLQLLTENSIDTGQSDGLIITGMRKSDFLWIKDLDKPFILFGENKLGYDYVDTDNQKGVELSTEYVISLGYEHIVFIGIDVDEPFECSREKGYLKMMKKHHLEPVIYKFENRSRYARCFIESNKGKFPKNTAFVCASDRLAIGIERGLLSQDCIIPDDFGVIGYDGVFLDQVAYPRLSTIKQPVLEMGQACASLLLDKINQRGEEQGFKIFEPTLIKRDSTR